MNLLPLTLRACLRLMLLVAAACLIMAPSPAHAQAVPLKVAVVDFSVAIDQIAEGKSAQARLEAMYKGKKAEIEALENQLMTLQKEYESKATLLTDTARQDYMRRMGELQAQYQQTYLANDQEMQQAYVQVMESLLTKLKAKSAEIGREKGYDLVLEVSQGAVVYFNGAIDITNEVIKRFP